MSGAVGFMKLRETVLQELGADASKKQSVALAPSSKEATKQ
jgi:hypothetical protein